MMAEKLARKKARYLATRRRPKRMRSPTAGTGTTWTRTTPQRQPRRRRNLSPRTSPRRPLASGTLGSRSCGVERFKPQATCYRDRVLLTTYYHVQLACPYGFHARWLAPRDSIFSRHLEPLVWITSDNNAYATPKLSLQRNETETSSNPYEDPLCHYVLAACFAVPGKRCALPQLTASALPDGRRR